MHRHRQKVVYFVIEGINTFACTYYFNYFFFLLRDQHGFGSKQNLMVSGLHGLIYIFAAWQGGRFAERFGFLNSLRLGFTGMAIALAVASVLPSTRNQIVCVGIWTASMLFTWPALEALAGENESPAGLQKMLGIYNCVWSGVSAIAYFIGGAMYDHLGARSLYWLPAALYLVILVIIARVAAKQPPIEHQIVAPHPPEKEAFLQSIPPTKFLKLAWFANPFAYVAIYTMLAVIPELARRLQLSATETGLFCSVWFFARFGAFVWLWRWTGWHYRFRWLLGSFIGLILSFAAILLGQQLWMLLAAQVLFGFCTGLIYYSSLFYSLDVGATKAEHGGLHEAAIGIGIFAGPSIGAAALQFAPARPYAAAWAVSALLILGLVVLIGMRLTSGGVFARWR